MDRIGGHFDDLLFNEEDRGDFVVYDWNVKNTPTAGKTEEDWEVDKKETTKALARAVVMDKKHWACTLHIGLLQDMLDIDFIGFGLQSPCLSALNKLRKKKLNRTAWLVEWRVVLGENCRAETYNPQDVNNADRYKYWLKEWLTSDRKR